MAKKKQKKQQGQQFLSPEQYIKQKARSLEIGACYVSNDIEEMGEGHVIVSRKHTGGRVSIAFYLVDIWCVGVKDSFYRLRLEDYEFKEMIDTYRLGLRECSYDEAHNWIFGAPAPSLFRPLRTHSPPYSVTSQHEIKIKRNGTALRL